MWIRRALAGFCGNNPLIVDEVIDELKEEIALLGGNPVLMAMHSLVYDILKRRRANVYRIIKIKHYSYQIGREDYRSEVLNALRGLEQNG